MRPVAVAYADGEYYVVGSAEAKVRIYDSSGEPVREVDVEADPAIEYPGGLLVVDGMKAQAAVAVQGGVLPADAVDAGDELFQAAGRVDVPSADFEFFRVQVFLCPGLAGLVFTQLEGRPVDAVVGPQRRRQSQPHDECRFSPGLEILRQDVRRVRP